MKYLPESIALLKSLGLSPNKSNFQAAAIMLATSIGLSDTADLEAKRGVLAEAIDIIKSSVPGARKAMDVCPLAAMLLASTISNIRANEKAEAEAAVVAHDKEVINDQIVDYEARVRDGEPAGDVAIKFVSDMVTLLGKELPGLLESVNKHFSRIRPSGKPNLELVPPVEPEAAPPADPLMESLVDPAPDATTDGKSDS